MCRITCSCFSCITVLKKKQKQKQKQKQNKKTLISVHFLNGCAKKFFVFVLLLLLQLLFGLFVLFCFLLFVCFCLFFCFVLFFAAVVVFWLLCYKLKAQSQSLLWKVPHQCLKTYDKWSVTCEINVLFSNEALQIHFGEGNITKPATDTPHFSDISRFRFPNQDTPNFQPLTRFLHQTNFDSVWYRFTSCPCNRYSKMISTFIYQSTLVHRLLQDLIWFRYNVSPLVATQHFSPNDFRGLSFLQNCQNKKESKKERKKQTKNKSNKKNQKEKKTKQKQNKTKTKTKKHFKFVNH